jgi:hypothetical protein
VGEPRTAFRHVDDMDALHREFRALRATVLQTA